MSKKFILILIIILIAVLVAVALYLFVFKKEKPKAIELGKEEIGEPTAGQLVSSPKPSPTIDQGVLVKSQLQRQAKYFLESYLTYSNQINYLNLEELLPMMTINLRSQVKEKINQGRAEQKLNQPYYGITTKVMVINLDKYQENSLAEFSASLQQQETKENETKIFYREAGLVLKKEVGEWKVDGIEVKNKI